MSKLVYIITILALLCSFASPANTPALARATYQGEISPSSASPSTIDAQKALATYQPYLTAPDSQPLRRTIPAELAGLYGIQAETDQQVGPYRTTVTIRGVADLAQLKQLGIPVLGATADAATVVVDRTQLEQLAKLHFFPHDTTLTSQLQTTGGRRLSSSATASELLAAAALDTDADGLTDTEEGWWCTDPNKADSNNDGKSDGIEVHAIVDWLQHTRTTRLKIGPPFSGWTVDHPGCLDADHDSVPDMAEIYTLGLNPNLESTPHDKYDDGQKLFGVTYCPGTSGSCSYGLLPRTADATLIFSQLPGWVKPPYDSPFVAAFPVPTISVIPSSFVMTAKTTIQTDHTIQNGDAKSYGTSETRGTSTSLADTVTWNSWQEVAVTTPSGTTMGIGSPIRRSSGMMIPLLHPNRSPLSGDIPGLAQLNHLLDIGIDCDIDLMGGDNDNKCMRIVNNRKNIQDSAIGAINSVTGADDPNVWQRSIKSAKCSVLPGLCSIEEIIKFHQLLYEANKTTAQKQERSEGNSQSVISTNGSSVSVQPVINISYPAPVAQPTTTETHGKSRGGAQTTTQTQYEEHTIIQSQQFSKAESWSNATAVDTVHAADLTFSYQIANKGTDYAREVSNIAFNIYLGDDPNPIYTYYPGADIGGDGTFHNFMPNETHTYASRPIPLTLNQMKSIDLGTNIFITVEDYSYGIDELFYQDALNSGVDFIIDSGDSILHRYVIPTWGTETVQDVAQRFFPSTVDRENNLLSLKVPDYTTPAVSWQQHNLAGNAWWNIYTNIDTSNTAFKDLPATSNSTMLIRMNIDTDLDGYNDRDEVSIGTDPSDPASHPTPHLVAATHSDRVENVVTATMAFLNIGNYDAYGIEAVMYAPDGTTMIGDNIIGGNGLVRAASQVVLGSRVLPPSLTNWHGSAKPSSTGSYSGNQDKVFTFTANNPGNVGVGTVNIAWSDGVGNTGIVNIGTSYAAPSPISIRDGVQIAFDTGTINAGDVFTVSAQLPRDTFSYTVTSESYTKPVVVVSYNDPQGNHKFVTTVETNDLGNSLTPFEDAMLSGLSLDVLTAASFDSSKDNQVLIAINSPDPHPLQNGHLITKIFDDTGTLVAQQVLTDTFQSGPTLQSVTFNVNSFNPAYTPGHDYALLAILTDAQGNIIDSHGRYFSTFLPDPSPALNAAPGGWNFGTVTQGAPLQRSIPIVNTGLLPLNVVVKGSDPALSITGVNGILSIPPAGTKVVTATLDTSAITGTVAISLMIRSNDPNHQTTVIPVNGTVANPTSPATAFDIAYHPWDKLVRIYGNVAQNTPISFTTTIQPDSESMEPCRVYDANGTTLKGTGKYCSDFGAGTVSAQIFGDGRDGDLVVPPGTTIINQTRQIVSGSGTSAIPASSDGFAVGDLVLFHQSQGPDNVGIYEFNTIAAINGPRSWTLVNPLIHVYTGNSVNNAHAQVIKVPQYRNVTIQSGGILTTNPWDGYTGGLLIFLANGTVNINGSINMTGHGFRGGSAVNYKGADGHRGEGYSGGYNDQTYISFSGSGGGGGGNPNHVGEGGGGGGHGTGGISGRVSSSQPSGQGGQSYGAADLSSIFLGAGGGSGGSGYNYDYTAGAGGNGGGIIFISGASVNITGGVIQADGNPGTNQATDTNGGGGGGAGGTVLLRTRNASLSSNSVTANYGPGSPGVAVWYIGGGNGGNGRIHLDYCDTVTGATSPSADIRKLTCYIADKYDSSTTKIYVPDNIQSGNNYFVQFGRRYAFAVGGGTVMTPTRILSQTYAVATMDALVTNVGAGGATNLRVDVGNQTIYSNSVVITQPATIHLPNMASAINQYLATQPANSQIDVPFRVTIDRQADVILTNLALTPGAEVDLAVGAGDLVLGCPGAASCQASTGNSIPISVTVHNPGTQDAMGIAVSYYAGNPASGGQMLGSSYLAAVPSGSSATTTFSWNTTGYTGAQTLYAVIDPLNAIPEILETNNTVSQTLTILSKSDVQVASISFTATDRVVGEPLVATIVISNTGENATPPSTTRVVMQGERGDTATLDVPTAAVPALGSVSVNATLAPSLFGTHTITATADVTNAIQESNESNNTLTRTVYVGLSAHYIDAGADTTLDPAYTPTAGYGYVNGLDVHTFGEPSITTTVRFNGSGPVQYRFDGLQPSRFYHLDAIFYQEGAIFTQTIAFDGIDSGQVITLADHTASTVSLLVPAAAYSDTTMIVSLQRPGSAGPAFVSQLALIPVEYTYIDAGSPGDLAYTSARGFGYLNGYASGSGNALATYRSTFTSTVYYAFDHLNPLKNYLVDLTMYEGPSSTRQQSITANGTLLPNCGPYTLSTVVKTQCSIPASVYAGSGRVIIGIMQTNGSGPIVNEIALEEQTSSIPIDRHPTLLALRPATVLAGSAEVTLVVTGTNFVPGAAVQWNTNSLTTTFISTTTLQATIPADHLMTAGIYSITVVTAIEGGGTSNPLPFTVAYPQPVIQSLSPMSITAGSGGFTLTVTGSGFVSDSVVQWKGVALATTYISSTTLKAVVPASNVAAPGIAGITVKTPGPGGGVSQEESFMITTPNGWLFIYVPVTMRQMPSGW